MHCNVKLFDLYLLRRYIYLNAYSKACSKRTCRQSIKSSHHTLESAKHFSFVLYAINANNTLENTYFYTMNQ